jgi:hypothetical protein
MRTIALNKDRVWRPRILQNLETGPSPIPSNTVVILWLSLTNGGPSIDVTKNINLQRSATNPKLWFGTTPKASVNAQLGALPNNTVVYVVVSVAGEIDSAPLQLLTVSPIG